MPGAELGAKLQEGAIVDDIRSLPQPEHLDLEQIHIAIAEASHEVSFHRRVAIDGRRDLSFPNRTETETECIETRLLGEVDDIRRRDLENVEMRQVDWMAVSHENLTCYRMSTGTLCGEIA